MIDAEDLPLRKYLADLIVDGPGARQILADRLLENEPRRGGNETFGSEPPRHNAEQLGRGRHVEHADAIASFPEALVQLLPAGIAPHVERHMVKSAEKSSQNVGSRAADGTWRSRPSAILDR